MTPGHSLTLQAVERITSVLILPHPEKDASEVRNLKPDKEVEMTAMQTAIDFEKSQGRQVYDVHEKNLGYDLTSIDSNSGELRLIEVKGISESVGTIIFTPNEKRVAEDRRDCFWLYVVTDCRTSLKLQMIKDPANVKWREVKKIDHYYLSVNAMKDTLQFKEETMPYGEDKE